MKKIICLISLMALGPINTFSIQDFFARGRAKMATTMALFSRFSFFPQAKAEGLHCNTPVYSFRVREFTPECNNTLNTVLDLVAELQNSEHDEKNSQLMQEKIRRYGKKIVENCRGQDLRKSSLVTGDPMLNSFVNTYPHLFPKS